jgi:hypothetical protein
MSTNNILPFCPTDTGTNLLTQGAYAAASDRTNGNQPGVASSKLVNKAMRQATFIVSQLAQFMADKTGSDVLDDGDTTALLAIFNSAFADPTASYKVQNLGLTATVAASALTVAMKDASGADASATSPVKIGFRSATAATGTYSTQSVTGALSLVVPSGATLGTTSAVASYLYIYAIYTGSAVVLGISGTRFDDGSVVSSTTISAGASSLTTMYSTVGQASKPCRLIGRVLSTQATAGTWASAVTEISLLPFVVNATDAFRSVTATDSALTTDSTVAFSGASFTFTLFTAVGNKGKKLTLTHQGTTTTQVYTIATTGGQTIGGASGYVFKTNGETIVIQSDGTNFILLERYGYAGQVLGSALAQTSAFAAITATAIDDDTIPQVSEATLISAFDITYTALSTSNKLRVTAVLNLQSNASATNMIASMFVDAGVNAVGSTRSLNNSASFTPNTIPIQFEFSPSDTSVHTYKFGIGAVSGAALTLNGVSGARKLGGVLFSSVKIEEIKG